MGWGRAKAILAFAVLLGVFVAVVRVTAWHVEPVAQESMHGIAVGLFDTYLIAFLGLAVLLTGALLGALYLAEPRGYGDDEEEVGR